MEFRAKDRNNYIFFRIIAMMASIEEEENGNNNDKILDYCFRR